MASPATYDDRDVDTVNGLVPDAVLSPWFGIILVHVLDDAPPGYDSTTVDVKIIKPTILIVVIIDFVLRNIFS